MEKGLIIPAWQYDEMQQVGTDYTDEAQVEAYDRQMQKLRDVKEETEIIIKSFFDNLIDRVRNDAGVELACDFEIATREEYTTLD